MTDCKKWLKRHGMLLVIVMSVVVAIAATVFVYINSKDLTAAGTVALAGFGAIGILFSYITMAEMKRDKRPYVYADIVLDHRTGHLFYAVVENGGNAPAHNIRFKVISPDVEKEMIEKNILFSEFADLSIIKHSIRFLPPSSNRRTLYGNAIGMLEFRSKIIYKVRVEYEDSKGNPYDEDFVLDLEHMMETSDIQEPYLKALNEIKKEIDDLKKPLKDIAESEKIQSGIYGYCKIHEHVANPKTGDCIICRSDKQDRKKAEEEK